MACAEDGAAAFIADFKPKGFPSEAFARDLKAPRTALSESRGRDKGHIENEPEGLDIHLASRCSIGKGGCRDAPESSEWQGVQN
jgi:hypothetical protein